MVRAYILLTVDSGRQLSVIGEIRRYPSQAILFADSVNRATVSFLNYNAAVLVSTNNVKEITDLVDYITGLSGVVKIDAAYTA